MSNRKKADDLFARSQIYEQRFHRFLNKIRTYQNQEVKKIEDKGKDEIDFESNKIISESHDHDTVSFGKRQKALDVDTKIKKSRKINEARLSKMKTRFQMIQKVQNQIRAKLVQVASGGNYKQLLKKLILQGMIKMLEESLEIKCLARDANVVNQILPECERLFGEMCEIKTRLVLNFERLPESDLGGVILTSFKGKIVCNNTLRARLDYAIQQSLPEVRSNLFPTPAVQQPPNPQGHAPQQQEGLI